MHTFVRVCTCVGVGRWVGVSVRIAFVCVCTMSPVLPHQGRVLYETLLYKEVPGHSDHWLLECCSKVVTDIMKHLRRYILRAQVCGKEWEVRGESVRGGVGGEGKG